MDIPKLAGNVRDTLRKDLAELKDLEAELDAQIEDLENEREGIKKAIKDITTAIDALSERF